MKTSYYILAVYCSNESLDNRDPGFRSMVGIIRRYAKKGAVFVAAGKSTVPFMTARQLSRKASFGLNVENWSNFDLRRTFARRVIEACGNGELLVFLGDQQFIDQVLSQADMQHNPAEASNLSPHYLELSVTRRGLGKERYTIRRAT